MYYSMDLRERVIAAVDSGMLRQKISSQFKISLKTIYLWLKRRKETGEFSPIINFQRGHSHLIKDLFEFKTFVDKCPDRTQLYMAETLKVSSATICRALKKINYSRKKRLTVTRNVMKKKELCT